MWAMITVCGLVDECRTLNCPPSLQETHSSAFGRAPAHWVHRPTNVIPSPWGYWNDIGKAHFSTIKLYVFINRAMAQNLNAPLSSLIVLH